MSHNHNHSCKCDHKEVAYCSHCRTVYCKGCNQEWTAKPAPYYYNPFTTTGTIGFPGGVRSLTDLKQSQAYQTFVNSEPTAKSHDHK